MLKRYAKLGLLLVLGATLSACSGDPKWKEEVQLSDGRTIVVEREILTEGGGDEWALNRGLSKPKEYRLRFEHPVGTGKMIEWWSIKKSPMNWPEKPLVLDVENDIPVVFSDVGNSSGCHIYIKYLHHEGGWIEEPLPPQFETHTTNLLILSNKEELGLVDLETKRKMNADVRAQDEKQVGPKHPYCR